MSDRFKFRGVLKLDTQNIVVYSSFLKNYDDELVLSVSENYFKQQVYKAGYKLTKEDWKIVDSYSDQDDYYPWFNFSCERVEQCTGLKDKNGKLIYEGDIIREISKKEPEWEEYITEVKWEQDGFHLADKDYFDYEVIGNIHENKELLDD